MNEHLIFEVSVDKKKGHAVSLYRSPSQRTDEFEAFLANLEKLISDISSGHSDFVKLIVNVNAKSRSWSNHDIIKRSTFGFSTDIVQHEVIDDGSTHILENTSSYIDLIFTNQTNIVLDFGVHSSLHPKCHHQIIYSKLCEIWYYNKAETDLINRSIENADWSNLFLCKNVHEQMEIFNQTIQNIFYNFISNKTILRDDRRPSLNE